MHDDSTSIMRSYTETTLAKSRKVPPKQKKKSPQRQDEIMEVDNNSSMNDGSQNESTAANSLASASEEELIAELARRRAIKYKLAGASKRLPDNNASAEESIEDPTGQMCSLTGGDGMIPCRELME
jgi:hypothetical protein